MGTAAGAVQGEGNRKKRLVGKCKMFKCGVLLHYCDLTAGLVLNNSTVQANSTSGIYYEALMLWGRGNMPRCCLGLVAPMPGTLYYIRESEPFGKLTQLTVPSRGSNRVVVFFLWSVVGFGFLDS